MPSGGSPWPESPWETGSGFAVSAAVGSRASGDRRRWMTGQGGWPAGGASVCGRVVAGGSRRWPENPGRVGVISRVLRVFGIFEMFVFFLKKMPPIYRKIP